MSSFLAVKVWNERSQQVCGAAWSSRPLAARWLSVTGMTYPVRLAPFEAARSPFAFVRGAQRETAGFRAGSRRFEDVVGQNRFLDISVRAEQFARRGQRFGDLGDDSGRAQIASFDPGVRAGGGHDPVADGQDGRRTCR